MWPIKLAFLLFTVCKIFLSFLIICTTSPFFQTIGSNWRSEYITNTTFQNSPDISDILPALSKFQQYAQLCSKYITFLVYSLNFSPLWQLCGAWGGVVVKVPRY
jgi:hypothetical protein